LVRKNSPDGAAARFAAVWAQLPASEQQRIISQVQEALRALKLPGEAKEPPRQAKHIRFQHGQVTVLNSARRARSDAAWAALAESGRQIQKGRR
jgi:hypothetical protein